MSSAEKTGLALAKFKPKAVAKSSVDVGGGSYVEPTEAQVESQRSVAKRNRILTKALAHVKQKWVDLCALKGHDRTTTEQKCKFTGKLFADTSVEDTGRMRQPRMSASTVA